MMLFMLQNCSVGIVGKDVPFTIYDDDPVERYVSFIAVIFTKMSLLC